MLGQEFTIESSLVLCVEGGGGIHRPTERCYLSPNLEYLSAFGMIERPGKRKWTVGGMVIKGYIIRISSIRDNTQVDYYYRINKALSRYKGNCSANKGPSLRRTIKIRSISKLQFRDCFEDSTHPPLTWRKQILKILSMIFCLIFLLLFSSLTSKQTTPLALYNERWRKYQRNLLVGFWWILVSLDIPLLLIHF